ncbi:TonB-dependent receptor [Aureibaculum sp. 2210JD6-5]|uniref:TonB-dependent receptor domain-containing protein n=1 Tax=Aureibaculum sp. 2210JD6-5 TaxID=3103957 RepID=UPI002AAD0B85|nr:TonB-dependent receptor [Aureibaculum sp. 2210JD6-5]MDY7396995.1 TonB-dependent receptor [Aureibaculum sp. 2210JD6-5]
MKATIQNIFFAIILCCSNMHISNAQNSNNLTTTITGQIIDKVLKEPISYATVIVKDTVDGKVITGSISNDDGQFEIENISFGPVLIEVQFIGYKTVTKEINISSAITNLGIIALEENTEELDSVEIIAERSTIEQRIDRKVINVGKDLTTAGASAADIMGNIPSVDLDQDGNLSLRGNTNVRVLLDGKPTNISANQLLQQIPSTSIKKIELITNPSAKYNPEGMSGIINIVLHKNTNTGFNGSINTGVIIWDNVQYNGSTTLNYRAEKFNLYGSYGLNHRKRRVVGSIFRQQDNSNEKWNSASDSDSHLFKIGLDYFINDKNTISVYTNQNIFDSDVLSKNRVLFNSQPQFINQGYDSERDNTNASYNFDYKHFFNEDNHTIELELDYNTYNGGELSDFTIENETNTNNYVDDINNSRNNTIINLDYVNPLSETATLEMGAEARLQQIDNTFTTSNNDSFNSNYNYNRDIFSLYTNYSKNIGKWAYQIGARIENYDVKGLFKQVNANDELFEDKIFSIYPSAFLKYTPNTETQNNSYQLSFSRRVDRPGLDQINPIRVWSSARVTNVGNPNLKPQFTNSIEANYTRKLNKGSITSGFFYRAISNEITRFAFQDPQLPSRILFSYNNYEDNTAYGFELSGNYKPLDWWSFNASFDIYAQTQKGIAEDQEIEVDNVLYNIKMTNNFKIDNNLTFQLFGLYRGANRNLQFETEAFYFVNAGARYSFANRKGTLSLNMNDIFKTQQFSFNGDRPLVQAGEFSWNSRTVYFGLSYRFGGKGNSVKRKKRDTNEKKGNDFL